MLRKNIVLLALLLLPGLIYGLDARITSLKGHVFVKPAGGKYAPARKGQKLAESTIIRTGVRSSVKIKLGESTSHISSLAKVKIASLKTGPKGDRIRLSLKTGKIRSRVKKLRKRRTTFKIRTPVATASVRGTEKEVSHGPGFGTEIHVFQGLVDIIDNAGSKRSATANQHSTVTSSEKPTSSYDENKKTGQVKLASPDLSETELDSISDTTDLAIDTLAADPLKNSDDLIDQGKKTNVNVSVEFQR